MDDYAENPVAQQLSQLSGVGQVLVGGQQTPAIRVQVDPATLASMGMTLEDVRNVLANATVDNPKGTISGKQQSYTIYANDQLTKAEPYNNIIIGYRIWPRMERAKSSDQPERFRLRRIEISGRAERRTLRASFRRVVRFSGPWSRRFGLVLVEAGLEHPLQGVLDAPVSAHRLSEACRAERGRGEI